MTHVVYPCHNLFVELLIVFRVESAMAKPAVRERWRRRGIVGKNRNERRCVSCVLSTLAWPRSWLEPTLTAGVPSGWRKPAPGLAIGEETLCDR